jgi:hypothetical protein
MLHSRILAKQKDTVVNVFGTGSYIAIQACSQGNFLVVQSLLLRILPVHSAFLSVHRSRWNDPRL